jgi:hypothetical protein
MIPFYHLLFLARDKTYGNVNKLTTVRNSFTVWEETERTISNAISMSATRFNVIEQTISVLKDSMEDS